MSKGIQSKLSCSYILEKRSKFDKQKFCGIIKENNFIFQCKIKRWHTIITVAILQVP